MAGMIATPTTRRPGATATITARYGLRPATVAHFGLHDELGGTEGTVYSVLADGVEVARRCKYTPAAAARLHRKYDWPGSRTYPLYHGDTLTSGCVAYLLAGEPDVWAAYQAGLIPVCFLMGEGCVPALGVRLLTLRRPAVVRIVYDLDPAGHRGADRACHALRAAGLQAEILTLPTWVGHKGDVADAYRSLRFDNAALRRLLDTLPHREPASPPPSVAGAWRGDGKPGAGVFARVAARADIVRLARRLTPLHANHDESRYTGLCPFHDDHHPSFIVWPATEDRAGRFCCRPCGLQGDAIELMRLALERGLRR